jgi:transposase
LSEIDEVLSPSWVKRVMTAVVSGDTPPPFRLTFSINEEALLALEEEMFAKRILFTDRDDWSISRVIAAYRCQHEVESDFRQMKDTNVVSFAPMFHWTEQKIRVHVLWCTLALTVSRLMVRQAALAGVDLSVRGLLRELSEIQETVLLYLREQGRPRVKRMLTEMSDVQRSLYDIFELDAYAPKR